MSEKEKRMIPRRLDEIVRAFPSQSPRVETGPIQFGDDWPGIFMRGDYAKGIAFYLESIIERVEIGERLDPLSIIFLKGLAKTLEECQVP